MVTKRRWTIVTILAVSAALAVLAAIPWISLNPGLPADSYVSVSGVRVSADFRSCSINFSNTGSGTATVLEINFTYSHNVVLALPAAGAGKIAVLNAHSSTSVNCELGSPELSYSEQPPAGTPGAAVVGSIMLDGEKLGFSSDFTNSSS